MSEERKHAKLPWLVFGGDDIPLPGIESHSDHFSIVVLDPDPMGDQGVQGKTREDAYANAAFIVRAANAHYGLLEACEEMKRTLTAPSRQLLPSTREELAPWLPMLDAAIRKATETAGSEGGE